MPDNYELPITASITCENPSIDNTTEPIILKPLYKDWNIDKFVNSNKNDTFKHDGAEVVVTAEDESGNPYLDDSTYVDFAFRVNNAINAGSNINDFRDASQVTLTDALPPYIDKDGNPCIAIFDPEANPGWELGADGTTVSKTYTGANSADVLMQIYNDAPLKLRFPGLKFDRDEKNDANLVAKLQNGVELEAIPSNAAEGETHPTASDTLDFVMTTDPSTKGKFAKSATKGNIYDLEEYKTNPYPWRVRLLNDGSQPLRHVVIQDRKIEGENGLAGLDPALKFVKLESDLGDSVPATGRTFASMMDKVIAYYEDGTTQDFPITDSTVNAYGNFTVEFDASKVCEGFEIAFEDDFELRTNEAVSFMAYTVYRDPDKSVVPDGTDSVYYTNTARSVNTYVKNGETVNSYLTVTHGYSMLPVTEELRIVKDTWSNSATENNRVGDIYWYYFSLSGSLLTPEQKEYRDLRIIDLLPNEVDYAGIQNPGNLFEGQWDDSANPIDKEIIENYHNSGRTAVILHFTYEKLKSAWDRNHNNAYVMIKVKIRPDAHPGKVRNDVYVVGDNLSEYDGKTGGALDIYDLDNDGKTDDMIAYAHSDAIIMAAQSIYAEKFVAPAGSEAWNKQGLSLLAGSQFDYLLKVTNELDEQTGLVMYDTLPNSGDCDIFNSEDRNSRFPTHLRGAIDPPEGYTVYYTTSKDVYSKSMKEMLPTDSWIAGTEFENQTDVTWSDVTAFKLVANEGTVLRKNSTLQVRIPACIPDQLSNLLEGAEYQEQEHGMITNLQANNSFGFKTNEVQEPKESNIVWVRVPFAGFTLAKVDNVNGEGLAEAEFTLADSNGNIVRSGAVDENGILKFRDLTAGTYTLTETKIPEGYLDNAVPLAVTIEQDPATMEYRIEFDESLTEAGTDSDPLLIRNMRGYIMPPTGGIGTTVFTAAGIVLIAVALAILYARLRRER